MGRRREVAIGLILAAALFASSVPVVAFAEDPAAEARAHYDRGIQLYEEGAFDAALVEFERAYELNPSWRIFYNIGLIHQQLNDYAAALETFERYLREGGNEIDAERRAEVDKLVEVLRARVAKLTIVVDVVGAELAIDDRPIGRSPLERAVVVNSGHHRVTATKDGRSVTKLVTVAALESATIELAIGAPAVEVKPAIPPPPPRIPWIAWGATAALTTGAVVTGTLALRASTKLSDDRHTDGVTRSTLDSDASKAKTLALVTDVLIGGAVIAAGVSVYLTLARPGETTVAPPATTTLRLGLGPGSVRLFGEF